MGENGERGAHPGRVGRRERTREAAVRRVCSADPREEAGARPAGSPRGGAGSGGGWPCPEHGRLLRQASFAANTHTHCACSPAQAPAWALGTQETQSAARRRLRHTSSPVSPSSWTPAMAPHSSAKTSIAPVARESPAPLSGLTASLPPCLIFLLWQHQSHFSSQAAPPATPGPLHVPFLLLVVSSCSPPTSAPSLFVFPDRI